MRKKHINYLLGFILFSLNVFAIDENLSEEKSSKNNVIQEGQRGQNSLPSGWMIHEGYPTPPEPKTPSQFAILLGVDQDPSDYSYFLPEITKWDFSENRNSESNLYWPNFWVSLMRCYESNRGRPFEIQIWTFSSDWGKYQSAP